MSCIQLSDIILPPL